MYNLLIYDCLNNFKFIYNIKSIQEEKLNLVFDLVLKEIQSKITVETHVSFIKENECEIYVYKERLQKGWLWNNLVPEKEILYKIEPIACLYINNIQFDNKECQTNTILENIISQESQTDNYQETETDNYQETETDNSQESQTDIQDDIYDDINLENFSYNLQDDNLSENSFKSSTDNINYFEDISWGQNYREELQNKLNLENFGLYKNNKHFKQD
jgi:hypothetical protein